MARELNILTVLAVLLLGGPASQAAQVTWIGGDAGWEDSASNWITDDAVPVNRIPIDGDRAQVYNGSTVDITAAMGTVPDSGTLSMIRAYGSGSTIVQTGGTVNTGSMWIGASGDGIYRLEGGVLNNGQLDISSLNQGGQLGHFIQTGGAANMTNIRFAYKGNAPQAYYEMQHGELNLSGGFRMGDDLSSNATTWFTQTGGTVTIGQYVHLGKKAGPASGPGSAIINLDDGEMTIEAATPFVFYQPGAPVYVDFDGGTLNLLGTWDFTSLTAIPDSDFRVHGLPATPGDLVFSPVDIAGAPFTAISAYQAPIPEPSTAALSALGLLGLAWCARRRRTCRPCGAAGDEKRPLTLITRTSQRAP